MRIAGSQPVARYAERKEINPKVAIFDGFAEAKEEPQHGDSVEKVVISTTRLKDKDIQNFQNSYERATSEDDVFKAKPEELMSKLATLTEETVTGFLQATARNLDSVVESKSIRVVNQSQSQCAARVGRPFVDKLEADESFRITVKEALGLPLRAHTHTVAEALLNEIQTTFDQSEKIDRAEKDYLRSAKKAYDKGIVHVVTAGNLGRLTADWEKKGINAPENAYRSVLATEYATIVGATDSRGTTTVRDDRAASFTSVYAGAEFSMHGVNVEVASKDPKKNSYSNGTSFAAPQMTGLISDMIKANPKLGVAKIEELLRAAAVPVKGTAEQLGAGQIDPDRALYLATQTAFIAGA
jgi:hypothetical protein